MPIHRLFRVLLVFSVAAAWIDFPASAVAVPSATPELRVPDLDGEWELLAPSRGGFVGTRHSSAQRGESTAARGALPAPKRLRVSRSEVQVEFPERSTTLRVMEWVRSSWLLRCVEWLIDVFSVGSRALRVVLGVRVSNSATSSDAEQQHLFAAHSGVASAHGSVPPAASSSRSVAEPCRHESSALWYNSSFTMAVQSTADETGGVVLEVGGCKADLEEGLATLRVVLPRPRRVDPPTGASEPNGGTWIGSAAFSPPVAFPVQVQGRNRCMPMPYVLHSLSYHLWHNGTSSPSRGSGALLFIHLVMGPAGSASLAEPAERCHHRMAFRLVAEGVLQSPATAARSSLLEASWGTVGMLVLTVLVKFGPRYVLRRTKQIDQRSFTGRSLKPPGPTVQAELLRQQREIIQKMKEEDGIQ